jgi:hypothetical protein
MQVAISPIPFPGDGQPYRGQGGRTISVARDGNHLSCSSLFSGFGLFWCEFDFGERHILVRVYFSRGHIPTSVSTDSQVIPDSHARIRSKKRHLLFVHLFGYGAVRGGL